MKKLIALAVAAASVPAMAAVTVSGDLEMRLVDADNKSLSSVYDDSDIAVTASSELDNGMIVAGKVAVDDLAGSAGTNSTTSGDVELSIAGSFGKLSLGEVDTASAMFDEKGEVNPIGVGDAGVAGGGNFVARYDLPTIVDGLSVSVSTSVDNDDTAGQDGVERTSFGIQYSVAGFAISAGTDSEGDARKDATSFGASYSANGLYVGIQQGENTTAGEDDHLAFGVSYTMGSLTIGYEGYDDGSATDSNSSSVAAKYSLGGGAAVYVDAVSKDAANSDSTTVGITYSF